MNLADETRLEQRILGAVLLNAESLALCSALEPCDFADPRCTVVFGAMRALGADGAVIGPATLETRLVEAGKFDAIGGVAFLSDLVTEGALSEEVPQLVEHVERQAMTRRVVAALSAGLTRHRQGLEGDDLLEAALAELAQVQRKTRASAGVTMRDLVYRRWGQLEQMAGRRVDGKPVTLGVPTGFADLDRMLGGGLPCGVLTVLGGRPSAGKSSLARSIADNASAAGFGVHYFSLEDDADALADRVLSDGSRVNLQRIRSAEFQKGDKEPLNATADRLFQRQNWLIDDSAGLSSAQVAIRVRQARERLKTRLVVVDYVQLMREEARDRRASIERSLLGLVELVRSENSPEAPLALLLLSQLNRGNEKEQRRPRPSDLRETGEIEQVASTVLLVHQDVTEDGTVKEAGVIFGKNKHGVRGLWLPLHWDAACATYRPSTRRTDGPHWSER